MPTHSAAAMPYPATGSDAASIPWHRAPSLPVAILLAIGPGLAVAQFRAMALAVTIGLLVSIAAHWRLHRALPWPRRSPVALAAAALLGWCLLSALWAVEPVRVLETAAALAALLLLGAMAARAVAEDDPRNLRRMGLALVAGVAAAVALLAFDHGTDNLFRRALRGFPPPSVTFGFGLKPAVSVLALFLPMVLAVADVKLAWRLALAGLGLIVALWLPGDSAKIAAVVGLAAWAAALRAPILARRTAAAVLALAFLLAPFLFAATLPRIPDLSALPRSAAHRVLIWDFVGARIAERPALGWGMEASRAVPGGDETFDATALSRFGLDAPEERAFFALPSTKRLPLHPHNAPLQVWLELGAVGAALAAALAALAALRSRSPAALGATIAGAVTGGLSFGAWQPWWVASLLLAAVTLAGLSASRR